MVISKKRTDEMMATAKRHWLNEDKQTGMLRPMPYVWIRNDETGELLIYTPLRSDAERILKTLKENIWRSC